MLVPCARLWLRISPAERYISQSRGDAPRVRDAARLASVGPFHERGVHHAQRRGVLGAMPDGLQMLHRGIIKPL